MSGMIIIDRFEGENAVLETDSGMIIIRRDGLPENAREGDVLELVEGAYQINSAATEERRAAVRAKFNRLRRKSND